MSDADRAGLSYIKETVFGVMPTSSPVLRDLLFTSESLGHQKTQVKSTEIRSDRQRDGLIRTSVHAAGAINFELWPTAMDDFFEAAIQSDAAWSFKDTTINDQVDVSVDPANGGAFKSATNGKFDGLSVGDWFETSGFSNTANNGFFKVTAVVSSPASVSISTLGSSTLTTESSGAIVDITKLSAVSQGTKIVTFSFEKVFADIASTFHHFLGMTIDNLTLNAAISQIITGSMDFLGAKGKSQSSTGGDGSNTPGVLAAFSGEPDPFTAHADHVGIILGAYGDSALMRALSTSVTIANNMRNKHQIGKLGPFEQGAGQIDVSGTTRIYFSSNTLYDTFINDNEFNAAVVLVQDDVGSGESSGYIIDMPRCKISDQPVVVGGSNQDVIADISWMAVRDVTEGNTVTIHRSGLHVPSS